MGMNVYGNNPVSEKGKYFRNCVWWWRPLADYCMNVAPDVTVQCQYWQSNDGDGLDHAASAALADVLQKEIDSGRCRAYTKIRQSELESLPNEPCDCCAGAGELTVPAQIKHIEKMQRAIAGLAELLGPPPKFKVGDKCPHCRGIGSVEPSARSYSFSVENVQDFVAFLRACGGFQIC